MANQLAQATSPYLLQHKDNPVDWRQWGEAALEEAKAESKPILLSVGYAACHWCHVMAHESFENEEIAALMNDNFINIKVDREERPDIDAIFQSALALLGEQGGWPLTMFLTPEGEPFWGGTYFPPEPRYGRPGFPQVLQGLADAYRKKPDDVAKNVRALKEALAKLSRPEPGDIPSIEVLDQVAGHMVKQFDMVHGGLGQAPKFPQPSILKLILQAWRRTGDPLFRQAFDITMISMSQGGLYDHLGGGYARYSVDQRWLAPHFEKMLYDNAQLLELLALGWQDSAKPLYAERAHETVDWLRREMLAEDAGGKVMGAFAATLDADSEGEEGKFYVWDEAEIDAALGPKLGDQAALFKKTYNVLPGGNWEGKTILNRLHSLDPLDTDSEAALAACRKILLDLRDKRVRPGWDDKVLADWNGLMIDALVKASAAFDEPDWLALAQGAYNAILTHLGDAAAGPGRLLHAWRHGKPGPKGMLEDYACMIAAAITLHEATGAKSYLAQAQTWIETLDRDFADPAGGYFQTAEDGERLVVRSKNANDNATPAGNGIMAQNAVRLFLLTGEDRWREKAEAQIRAFAGELNRNFFPLTTILMAAEQLQDGQQVVIIGDREASESQALIETVNALCLPNKVLRVIAPEDDLPEGHPAKGKKQIDGKVTAFVCRGTTCSLPVTDPGELAKLL